MSEPVCQPNNRYQNRPLIISAMIGTEAAMVAVDFLSRIGLPYPSTSRSGATLSHALGQGWAASRDGPPSMKAQLRQTPPAPVRIAYGGLGFLIVAAVALILIEARYL